MTAKEFLVRYDAEADFSEIELKHLWWDDLFEDDENVKEVEGEDYGEPDRWVTCVTKVIKIYNRYFMIYCLQGNTECQDSSYDIQPTEVKPYKKIITGWRPINASRVKY